jgi:hypothetical protein
MEKVWLGLAGAVVLIAPAAAEACSSAFLGSYNTRISGRDIVSSAGARLGSVGAIIQQDRANFHRFGRRDRGDQGDDMFRSAESRALIPRWLHDVPPVVAAAIRRGDAYINVRVYEGCIDATFA